MVTKTYPKSTYLPTCLPCKSRDSCDSVDSVDSSECSDSDDKKLFFIHKNHQRKNSVWLFFLPAKNHTKNFFLQKKTFFTKKVNMWQNSKSKWDETQKPKILQNSENQNVTKHKNSKCDKTHNVSKLRLRQISKLKMWQMWQNVTTFCSQKNFFSQKSKKVTKLKTQNVFKLKNPNFEKTQKKTQNVTKLKNSKCDKTKKT